MLDKGTDAGEAVERRDKHHCIFVFLKNNKGLASKSCWGQRLPETGPPLQLSVLAEKLGSEYALRLPPVAQHRFHQYRRTLPCSHFLWE